MSYRIAKTVLRNLVVERGGGVDPVSSRTSYTGLSFLSQAGTSQPLLPDVQLGCATPTGSVEKCIAVSCVGFCVLCFEHDAIASCA